MTQREDKEKQKISHEIMGKFFYDLEKAVFIITVAFHAWLHTKSGNRWVDKL